MLYFLLQVSTIYLYCVLDSIRSLMALSLMSYLQTYLLLPLSSPA